MQAPLEHGRYVLSDLIGDGAMGLVYRAFDRELGHDVALKTLRSALPDDVYHLKREFRSLLDIDHPNLVHLYDLVVGESQCFFTMELVTGPRIDDWIRAEPSPASLSRRAASAAWQLAAGLGALHAAGKIHRDIKPSNVLVTPEDRVILLDMGLVSNFTSNRSKRSQHGQLAGTLEYMAPEQGRGEVLTPAADWFAVGVVLYEAITGALPWDPPGRQHFGHDAPTPDPVHAKVRGVSEELSRLISDLLSPEPQVRPQPSEILKRLQGIDFERPPNSVAVTTRPGFSIVGRSRELSLLRSAFDACVEGQSRLVCVGGASGIGKTTLIENFVEGLEERSLATVFRSRCHYRELIPFKAVDGLVDQITRFLVQQPPRELDKLIPKNLPELARMFPVLERVRVFAPTLSYAPSTTDSQTWPRSPLGAEGGLGAQRTAFACLRELLARIAAHERVVLWIDDLQWSDLDSIRLIKALLKTASSVLFVFSYRHEDADRSPPLRSLLAHTREAEPEGRVLRLDVPPLSVDEVEVLASELLDGSSWGSEVARRAAESAHGSPFFLKELVRDLADKEPSESPASMGRDVAELIRARVARLPDAARELVELISIAGCPLAEHIARRSFARSSESALSLLRNESLLRIAPAGPSRGIDVYHDQVREAVNAGLSTQQRRQLHTKLAQLLEELEDSDPHLLVHHFLMAEQPERAALAAQAAADRAMKVLAFDLEASLIGRALELGAYPEAPWLGHQRIARALSNAGRGLDAAHAFARAADELERHSPGHSEVSQLRLANAEHLLRCGVLVEGLNAVFFVLQGSRVPHHRTAFGAIAWAVANRPRVAWYRDRHKRRRSTPIVAEDARRQLDMLWSAGVGLSAFFPMRALEFQVRHSLLAYKTGAPEHIARALSTEAVFLALEGSERSIREADALQIEAVRISERIAEAVTGVHVAMNTAAIAFLTARPALAVEHAGRAIAACGEHGELGWERVNSLLFAFASLGLLGEIAELRERQADGLEEARQRDDQYAAMSFSLGLPSAVWLADDEVARLRSYAEQGVARMPETTLLHFLAILSLTHADLYDGNPQLASRRMNEFWGALRRSFNLRIAFIRIEAHYARGRAAAAAAGEVQGKERTRLRRAAASDARSLRDERFPYANHYADCIEASIAALDGDVVLATELLERAALGFTTLHMSMHAATCRYQLAEHLSGELHRSRANFWFDAHSVVNPRKLSGVFVPLRPP